MTAQAREVLIYNSEEYGMASEPFAQYMALKKFNIRLKSPHTALWRGYFGKWEIEENKLFLTDISGHGVLKNDEKYKTGRLELRHRLKQGLITPQENGHLLRKFEQECFEKINLSLMAFFNSEEKVFASWFSGKIYVPFGEILQYIHIGYASIYEKEMIFSIKEGVVVGLEIKINDLKNQPNGEVSKY